MSIAVTSALVEAGDKPIDELMPVMARHFAEWSVSPENNRAPGITCMTACQKLVDGFDWRDAGVKESKGCGSAMRAAPIGLYYHQDIDRVIEVAAASSVITHGHPTGVAAAAGAAVTVALLLNETQPAELLDQLLELTGHLDGDYAAEIRQVRDALMMDPDEAMAMLGEAWVGEEALADALYCFLRSPNDCRQTVLAGANTAGDSDSIACIAGAFSGVYNGIDAIPQAWRDRVENSELLHDLAGALWRKRWQS